jgi:RimJ/RimL family protein N-acetyltransferase
VDFNRGAARSDGGKAIIATPSTAKNGTISRIVTHLAEGAGVVTTRGDVHYVVTEYGVAYLHGESIHDRAIALISIAHPKFRARLLKEAIKAKYISADMVDKAERFITGPKMLNTTHVMPDGTQIKFRPVHPTDEPRMRRLFYNLSDNAVYNRFMSYMKRMTPKQLGDFVYLDHRTELAMVGTIPIPGDEEIIALCQYYLDPSTNRAEVAFTVGDQWQGKGLGTFMFRKMAQIAKRYGIKGLTADVLADNASMAKVFTRAHLKTRITTSGGVQSFIMDF